MFNATFNFGFSNYLGNAHDIKRSMLETNSFRGHGQYPTIWFSAGMAAGAKLGATVSYTPPAFDQTVYGTISRQVNIGAGLPVGPLPLNGAAGVSNTVILYDFYK